MPKYEESGVSLVLDISDYRRNVQEAIDLAKQLDSIGNNEIKISADTSGLDDAKRIIDDLDAGTVTTKINVDDSELSTANRIADDLDAPISTEINVDTSDLDSASSTFDTIKSTAESIAHNFALAGAALTGIGAAFTVTGVKGVIDYDNALAMIQGRTGQMIPGARELIHDIYTNGWGESRDQIAEVIVQATNLGIAQDDLKEATMGAFEVAAVTGGDTNEVLRTMDSLVKNNLVPSYTTAADLITTGFQTGADRGQDLLDTFNEYGSTFSELGISGQGALALINSGLEAGIDNSDRVADALRESGIRLREMGTDPKMQDAFKQLDDLSSIDLAGLLDAYNQGAISGDEFWNGFFAAFGEANAVDPAATAPIFTTLVGTQSEDFGPSRLSQLTTDWDTSMGDIEGRAAEAGTAISDTLGSSISTFMRMAEEAAVQFLSSEQIDLPGKIELLKQGLQDALAVLQEGGTLGEALTVALKPIGFDDEFKSLESALGNFVIGILQAVATLQDITGHGTEAAATRKTVSGMAQTQLAFDLQTISPDDAQGVADSVNTALARGIDPTTIGDALSTAVDEMVKSGSFQEAQALIDNFKQVGITLNPGQDVAGTNAGISSGLTAAQLAVTRGGEQAGAMSPQGQTNAMLAVEAQTQSTTALTDMASAATDLTATSRDAEVSTDEFKTGLDELKTTTEDTTIDVDTLNVTTGELADAAFQANEASTLLGDSWADVSAQVADLQQKLADGKITVEQFDAAIVALTNSLASTPSAGGGSAVPATGKPIEANAEGGTFTGLSVVGEQGPELISSNRGLAVLNNRTTQAIMSALSPAGMSMNADYSGGNTYAVYNTNYVQSQAQADAMGYSTAKQIRGI